MRRVGVFGGTFDPVHVGHIVPAARAAATFRLDELLFVPAGDPPHKQGEPLTSFAHRFAMLALATAGYDRFLVSDIEVQRPGPTYTVDTLRLLRDHYRDARLYFLMGSDSFAQISTWHRWDELLALASLVVLRRPGAWGDELVTRAPAGLREAVKRATTGAVAEDPASAPDAVYLFDHEPLAASATELRALLRSGGPVGDLLPPEVYRYIVKHRLYQHAGEPVNER